MSISNSGGPDWLPDWFSPPRSMRPICGSGSSTGTLHHRNPDQVPTWTDFRVGLSISATIGAFALAYANGDPGIAFETQLLLAGYGPLRPSMTVDPSHLNPALYCLRALLSVLASMPVLV